MARIKLVEKSEATGAEKVRYDELAGRNAVTNMKKGLLNDAATYDAYITGIIFKMIVDQKIEAKNEE